MFLFSSLSCSCPSLIVQKKCDESHYYHLFNVFLKFVPYLDSGNLSPSNQAYSHNMSSGALGKGRLQSKIWMNFLKNSKRPLTTAPTQPGKLCCAFFSPEIHCFFPRKFMTKLPFITAKICIEFYWIENDPHLWSFSKNSSKFGTGVVPKFEEPI